MGPTANGKAVRHRRAGLIRLARLAAQTLRAAGHSPARVSVIRDPSAEGLSCSWRALPSGGRALEVVSPDAAASAQFSAAFSGASTGSAYPVAGVCAPAKVLLFRSLLEAPGKEGADRLNQGALYLASSLRAAGVPLVFSDVKVSRFAREAGQRERLARLLDENPDIGLIALSLYDAYFEDAALLVEFVRSRSRARVAIGALMPTRDPEAALVHLPGVDFAARGAGEESLPRLAALAGRFPAGSFDESARGALLGLDGVLACDADRAVVWAGAEKVLRVADLDDAVLDLSLLERRDAESGPTFCLSRGCGSACRFCTSPDQGLFHGKSAHEVGHVLAAYGRRLKEIYGSWGAAPDEAFGVGFYDDDFLCDPDRALAVLEVVRRSPFHIRFIQASVRAFFRRGPNGRLEGLDDRLLDALSGGVFAAKLGRGKPSADPQLYLGTESFCDAELERLGKGYGAAEVSAVARALSSRGVRQAHHFIATNARTRPEDVLESLARIVRLREECGRSFSVLEPVISHLISFPGTASLRALERSGLADRVETRGVLSVPGFPEYDYALVERDAPLDPDVAAWAERLAGKAPGLDWEAQLEGLLFQWLLRSESLTARGEDPERAARLRRAVDLHAGRVHAVA